ncbi:MAG: SDR family oxidoreductase [candidate division Zixibacteria bacterium]|nr:SDR family oxidoreductase [candidate division Zixibacteria bacterium]
MKTQRVLVIGATGYVGSQLVPCLLREGHHVTCLVRNREKMMNRPWNTRVKIHEGDVLKPAGLKGLLEDQDVVYYLVHSMATSNGDFAELDRCAAANIGRAAKNTGVKRIIYLGGLGRRQEHQSLHLKSRHEVGDVLRQSGVPVTEFRAAVIIGAGSLSFEMVHHLANRLPVMICPRWVITRTQPISIDDVTSYLVAALDQPESVGKIIDIGGPEVLTYRDMILVVARVLGLHRLLIKVPVLTPRLSSYWVGLVTPIPIMPARALIEGLRHETVCENDDALTLFDIRPKSFEAAVRQALAPVLPGQIARPSSEGESVIAHIEPSHILIDQRKIEVEASSERVFKIISSIGGNNGWYCADTLWKIRGFIDQLIGGVGLRRGRGNQDDIALGEALDFWRVEELEYGRRMLLRAEMKVPGKAWLEFEVKPVGQNSCVLTQTARFYPRGLLGLLYWYGVYPVHVLVFRGMASAIARRSEAPSVD